MQLSPRGQKQGRLPCPPLRPQAPGRHSAGLPHRPPLVQTSCFQTAFRGAGSQGGGSAQGRGGPNQTVLHILCSSLRVSSDGLGHLVPPSWGRGDITEMALGHGGRGEEARQATRQDDLWVGVGGASNFMEERKAKPNNLSSAFEAQRANKRCKNISLYIYI